LLFEVNVFIHGLDKRKELKLVFGRHEAKQNKATTFQRPETFTLTGYLCPYGVDLPLRGIGGVARPLGVGSREEKVAT
jgi:hypothetical protein